MMRDARCANGKASPAQDLMAHLDRVSRVTQHVSKPQSLIHVRAVNGTVATRRPTTGPAQEGRVRDSADENFFTARNRLVLRMASQAKVCVVLDEHHAVDGAVGVVANRATFAQRFVLEHDWSRLLTMTLGAAFVEPGHRESAGGLENVDAVRVVALHAVHATFDDGMMLRQIELCLRFQMTGETSCRVLAGIHDEFAAPAARLDVQAAGSVAGFAAALTGKLCPFKMHPRVRTRGKHAHVIRVALETSAVANVSRPRDFWRGQDSLRNVGTRVQKQRHPARDTDGYCWRQGSVQF